MKYPWIHGSIEWRGTAIEVQEKNGWWARVRLFHNAVEIHTTAAQTTQKQAERMLIDKVEAFFGDTP